MATGASYAYYRANDNEVDDYAVPGRGNSLLGFANHQATVRGTIRPLANLSVSPSVIVRSKRYAYMSVDADEESVIGALPAAANVNLYTSYDGLAKGLSIGAGVFNMLDSNLSYAQPYNSDHAPLPGQVREFIARASYSRPL